MFSSGKEEIRTFDKLKQRFMMALIRVYFEQECQTVIETDASDLVLGSIGSQFQDKRLHPVAFHSRK